MPKIPKSLKDAGNFILWLGTLITYSWWSTIITAGSVALAAWRWGKSVIVKPLFHSVVLVFVATLWTLIGLSWLSRRKPKDVDALRYGITVEGITPVFEGIGLQFGIAVRNYSPVPLRYWVEEFEVKIDTRTLPTKYKQDSLTAMLPRGSQRTSSTNSFKMEHLMEFLGKRVEGSLDFSIKYGDADKEPVRRTKMSLHIFLVFPNLPEQPIHGPLLLGFNSSILEESDEPIPS